MNRSKLVNAVIEILEYDPQVDIMLHLQCDRAYEAIHAEIDGCRNSEGDVYLALALMDDDMAAQLAEDIAVFEDSKGDA